MSVTHLERVNRFLARRGVASRRGADALIVAGRVVVNGSPASLGDTVNPDQDVVSVDGSRIAAPAPPGRAIMLNKPVGVVSTVRDPQNRPTVMDLVEATPGLVPAGRLDADSRGLLLLTSNGTLVHRLTHPRYGVLKRYRVRLDREVDAADLRDLIGGVELDDGPARAVSARRAGKAAGYVIDLSLAEGRKREVRRLCAALGLEVVDLVRVGFGPLHLGHLEEGASRLLTPAEERSLFACVRLAPP